MNPQYPEVLTIARSCQHVAPGPKSDDHLVADGEGGWIKVCLTCSNLVHAAYKRGRKVQLAARPKDCDRCGLRPHTFTYAAWKLCGRCLTLTKREHAKASANAGALAIFATAPLVDTTTWAGRKT